MGRDRTPEVATTASSLIGYDQHGSYINKYKSEYYEGTPMQNCEGDLE